MIEIGYFKKLLTLLKTIDRLLNGVDTAKQKDIDMYRQEKNVSILFDMAVYRYIVIFIDIFPITSYNLVLSRYIL